MWRTSGLSSRKEQFHSPEHPKQAAEEEWGEEKKKKKASWQAEYNLK